MTDDTTEPDDTGDEPPTSDDAVHPTASATDDPPAEPESFDRAYVTKLREENAGYRVKAKRADTLASALVTAHAALTGKLADPTDLPYDDELLDEDGIPDPEKIRDAVEDLLARKPHLAARRPVGNVGQGARPDADTVGLAALLRRGA